MEINNSLLLPKEQYYPVAKEKTSIVLHHTAGSTAKGAISWWRETPEHVGTAYVIDKDGTIYKAFEDNCWAYHLGMKGDDDFYERSAVGIELVSRGWVAEKNGKFFFMPLYPSEKAMVEVKPENVDKVSFRGQVAFEKYTVEQISSTVALVDYLIKKYSMPIKSFDGATGKHMPELLKTKKPGLYTHANFRKDKVDVYPSKDLIKAFQEYFKGLK